ncbi:P4 alpha zinc-binding domain protein [Sphingomonas populi]|uniref:P4 alpha zinc-binding domain protein n=1 Tax=Sphingomonas populi TaxID=2484750 RepID=A0A4V2DBT2_9SPHN|nr:primase-helicase zinc-binding domain-containing protein [Sphingomonas populi]RZF59078.1 P4 alpha zinc-binding domain protein [Sphingomonas populi]
MTRLAKPELREQARGRWRAILPLLAVPTGSLDGKQHPCPVCGGKDRFRFDDLEGNGTWYCNMCGAGDGARLAMAVSGLSFVEMAARVRELIPGCSAVPGKPVRDDDRCIAAARAVWTASFPIAGTMAEDYLRSRGAWSADLAQAGALRFVPRLKAANHDAGHLPAMVARVTDAAGRGVNVHRTFLREGRKAYRAMMPGPVPPGAAIRLAPAGDRLGIAEGIETAIKASIRFGVPCWSAITAGGVDRWTPPPGVSAVDIFGDHDRSFTGQAVSYALARRLTNQRAPIACAVHIPKDLGTDWADEPETLRLE